VLRGGWVLLWAVISAPNRGRNQTAERRLGATSTADDPGSAWKHAHHQQLPSHSATMSRANLRLSPEALHQIEDDDTPIRDALHRLASTAPVFSSLGEGPQRTQAFIAPTPELALRWICRRVNKQRLLRFVNDVYDNPIDEVADTDAEPDSDDATAGHEAPLPKRKRAEKETTTKQANKKLKEKFDSVMLQTVASTQDWRQAKRNDVTLDEEERRYKTFVQKLPGTGVELAANMVAKAAAIGTVECLRDWRTVLKMWRRQHAEGGRLFSGIEQDLPSLSECEDSGPDDNDDDPFHIRPDNRLVLSQRTRIATNEANLNDFETQGFTALFNAAQRSQTSEIVGDMRHRWIMAAMFEQYEALETLVRKRQKKSARGRGFATVAKEHLFGASYKAEDGTFADAKKNPVDFREFGRELEFGKRWCMLKAKFGVGVFALLPRGIVTNHFIERGMSMTRYAQWIEMIRVCNSQVETVAQAIQPLYVACMTNKSPPERLVLEAMRDDEFPGCDPHIALSTVTASQQSLVELGGTMLVEATQYSDS